MRLIVTRRASRKLQSIRSHIEKDDPLAARRVEGRIFALLDHLTANPKLGRTWDANTRALVVTPYPYRIHYSLADDALTIITFAHTAQRPPRL